MRMATLALSIAGVFAVPAVIGALLGVWVDKVRGTGQMWTIILLSGAFLISWILVIGAYRRSERKLKDKNGRISKSIENKESNS